MDISIDYFEMVIFLITTTTIISADTWVLDKAPRLYIPETQLKSYRFYGNVTDYFKILDQDDSSILIGARNAMYNLSLSDLRENEKQRIVWMSSDAHRELCALKGKHDQDCQNYIRVYARISQKKFMICGTNSYKPLCRFYSSANDSDAATQPDQQSAELVNEIEAQGRCPYNPTHNSTYVFTDGQLYSATVADFSGADPLIYRETQRTEQYDLKQLNQPAFVSAAERNGYVFFFFREIAVEYINSGKAIYSRVGRVCKNDKGGPYPFNDRWTTFLKTRLNCSIPGEYPFYFDEIQATSQIVDAYTHHRRTTTTATTGTTSTAPNHIPENRQKQKDSIIYAIFTTPMNAIPGSAICAFSINDILRSFEGPFKAQKDINSNWLPIPADSEPDPRPGKCVDDSRTLPTSSVNFVKTHTLMDMAVPALHRQPILTRVNLRHRFTAITVDPQITDIFGLHSYDVIFVGTDDGRIVKFISVVPTASTVHKNSNNGTGTADEDFETILITETQVLPFGMQVRQLTVSRETERLIVVGNGQIVSIPLYHCSKIIRCRDCINLRDPYCAWDINNHECTHKMSRNIGDDTSGDVGDSSDGNLNRNFIQNIQNENVDLCKKYNDYGNSIDLKPQIVVQSSHGTVSSIGRQPSNMPVYENEISVTSVEDNELHHQIIHRDPLVKEPTLYGGDTVGISDNGGGDVGAITGGHNVNGMCSDGESNCHGIELSNSKGLFVAVIALPVFVIGVIIGFFINKCRNQQPPGEHRNQLNWYSKNRHMQPRNAGKDINLLMNTNANPFPLLCNNKKDNLEQKFAKDRTHECKNSTENLEKEVHCKTGTLQKVKKTYI